MNICQLREDEGELRRASDSRGAAAKWEGQDSAKGPWRSLFVPSEASDLF